MRGVEMGDDVRHLLPGEIRDVDAALFHPGPHHGPVVPHEAGELREADVMGPAQFRADTALSADRVAGRALLVTKQLFASLGSSRPVLRAVPSSVVGVA